MFKNNYNKEDFFLVKAVKKASKSALKSAVKKKKKITMN